MFTGREYTIHYTLGVQRQKKKEIVGVIYIHSNIYIRM